MLEKVLQTLLRRYFGQFIAGLENVELAFWTGKINIQNASFRHQKINEILRLKHIPLSIKFSFLGSLQLDIPWNKLSSAPVQIKISNVYVVFALQKLADNMPTEQTLQENAKILLIKNYVAYMLKKSQELKSEGQNESGFLKKLMLKVLHNVNIQINNVHVRIQSGSPRQSLLELQPGEELFFSCLDQNDKPIGFSMGFCIENIDAQTINEKGEKQYVQITSSKTPIRKTINLRQISLYWQEQQKFNLLNHSKERRVELLKQMIGRQEHRLLTIDGSLLMEKNRDLFDFFFSTSFRVLEVKMNYLQLKQIIQVVQQFANAKTKKKIIKMKEIKHELQLKLQDSYKQIFRNLYFNKFQKVQIEEMKIIDKIDKKLLMKWTKQQYVQLMKNQKLKTAFQSKNKKTWLSFLSKNSRLELTEDDIRSVNEEIIKFVQLVEEKQTKISFGIQLTIKSISLLMQHRLYSQKLLFLSEEISLSVSSIKQHLRLNLKVLDISLKYHDLQKMSEVSIFRKTTEKNQQLMYFQLQNDKSVQKLNVIIEQFRITHEIQFLGFISEMINLQQREEGKVKVILLQAQAINNKNPESNQQQKIIKIYDYNLILKKMEIKLQLDNNSQIYTYIEAINIQKNAQTINTHSATLTNFGLIYINSQSPEKSYQIIENINITVSLVGLKQLRSSIPKIKVILNEQCLYQISNCLKKQYKMLQMREIQYKKQLIQEQQKIMEGQTQSINMFKSLKIYHTVLTSDKLIFYQQQPGDSKINLNQPSKTILLHNMTISRRDDFSFKLESKMMINQIIHCKSKQDTDQWLYLIEQRIYEISSKQQIFTMADYDNEQKDSQPHIYIPYDSTIDLSVNFFEVILQKNSKQKILSINLNSLNIILKENNLQFQRKVNLQQICIKNLSLVNEPREQYYTILSNIVNYFQDPVSDSESEKQRQSNITVKIQGKKKTHPKYTGEISIKSNINRLFINYNAQFIFSLLYRFTFGQQQAKPFPQAIRNAKIIQFLKQILQDSKNIPEKYQNAQPFQFSRSFIQLEKYRQIYSGNVLFHVELAIQEFQMYVINGRSNLWLDKIFLDGVFVQIDKSTQFIFAKGRTRDLSISDLTGYPKTSNKPFTQAEPYPLLETHRKQPHSVVFSAGLFEPLVFINKERFKNFFQLTFNDLTINYQQQPFMRLVDSLINQIIMFALEPFSLHKFDTPNRGSYAFGAINFTQKQIKKILKQSIYPFYTHLRIHANRLTVNFNSHPNQQSIQFFISTVKLISAPYINNQRTHVKLDVIKQFQKDYHTLLQLRQKGDIFQNLVSKFQWATRYLINLDQCKCDIFQNTFNYEMYFQRVNNGDKDILLPFLKIDKDLLMEGRIKNINITANKKTYNLINKCFNFNLSFDDGCQSLYNTNYQFEHLNTKNKLIYRLFINQLSYLIPQLDRTVFVIPNCQYKFQKQQNNTKVMEVIGRSLHIFDTKQKSYLIKPVQFDQPIGFMFGIGMNPSGQKKMYVSLKQIQLTYLQDYIMALIKYFILDDSCNPKQQHYPDIPLIRCQADILNSYIKIAQYQDYVFALKGSIRVIWTRNKNTHPQVYKQNKDLYPNNSQANSYDIELKGASLCKYNKKQFEKKSNIFRPLSSLIICKVKLTNIMKRCNDIFYTDMQAEYIIDKMQLKVCYKDIIELQECFKTEDPQQTIEPRRSRRNSIQTKLPYVPNSKHSFQIKQFSLQMGLSQLPVPLLDLCLHNSTIKAELLGNTKIFTSVLELTINYWNMLIGRWQPLLEKVELDVILRLSKENYYSISSKKPLLLNFSIENLKVLKLLSNDFTEKGNMRMLSHQNKLKDIHVSPYAITNRTGYNIFMDNLAFDLAINSNKLKNNDTMHIRNKNGDIQQTFDKVKYQIEGDANENELHLNIVQAETTVINYNGSKYQLIYQVISSPILKEIVISSPFIIHNKTTFKLILTIGSNDFVVDQDKKIPIPFTQNPKNNKSIKVTFPHLKEIKKNCTFTFQDVERTTGYDHCIIHGQNEAFYCCFQLEIAQENIISISPLTTLINLTPLSIKMQVAFTQHRGDQIFINQTLDINQPKILYQFGCRDSVSARIVIKGFNISSLQNLGLVKDKNQVTVNENDEKIIISDHRGLESYIKTKIKKKHKKKSMYFYTECVLINQSSYHIYLFSGTQLIPGQSLKNVVESQSKYIFINDLKDLSIGFRDDDPSLTQKLSLQSLGNQYLLVAHQDSLYELVVHSSVHCVDEEMQLFTRLLKLTPRYILINECTRGICFRQINTDQRAYLRIKQRIDWYWHSKDQIRQLTVTASDNQFELADGWDFSAPFQLQNLQEMIFVLRPKVKSPHRLLLKVQIIKEQQFTYLIFKELKNIEDSLITIKNNMRHVRLEVNQQMPTGITPSWIDFKHFQCPPVQQMMFGWDFPSDQHTIDIRFNFLGAFRTKYQDNVAQIDVTKLNKPLIIEFIGDDAQNLQIEVSLQIVGIRRKLIFQYKDESQVSRQNEEQQSQISGSKMGLSLEQIGISIISGRKPRCQIIFISIKKLEVIMMEKQYKRNLQLKIKYINIDNNLNHNTMFPVLFTPLYQHKTFKKNRPFFICLVEQNLKSQQIMEINYFRMAMEPISFKLYDQIITKLYDMQKEFSNLTQKQKKIDLCETFRSEERLLEWQCKEPSKSDRSIFLRQVQIGKIIIELSFSIKPTSGGNIIIYTIVTLFKTVMSNVSESQIKLSRFIRKNINMGDLSNQLSEFYRKQVFKEIYKIPGSINILGNPYVFVKYMAEGVWEIINQPSQGFIKGPIQGAIGVFKGGIYCSRNIIAGTFNSLQVISQSCSQGISYVTFDEKFMTRRQKIQMQKSKHIGEGTKSALFALYTGVQIAFTGLYRLPKQNYNKSGTPGFFKGVVLGIAGLFTKPLSGLFEGISKFSQGIKQTALFFQDGPNSTRSRPPRVFIGIQQFYTEYSLQESKAINLLEFHSTKHLNKNIMFVSADKNPDDDKDYFYTVLTNQYLVLLNKSKKKILREIRIEDITQVDPRNNQRDNKLIIKFGDDQTVSISSHKSAQLYQCFKMLFETITKNDDDNQDEAENK